MSHESVVLSRAGSLECGVEFSFGGADKANDVVFG